MNPKLKEIMISKPFWFTLVGLAIVAFIYFSGKKAGKRGAAEYPKGGKGIPQSWDATPVVVMVEENLNPWSIFTRDLPKVYNHLMALTDDQLAAVSNVYLSRNKKRLVDEIYWWNEIPGDSISVQLKGRLDSLTYKA